MHKAIRRLAPAPTYKRAPKGQIVEPVDADALKPNQTLIDFSDDANSKSGESASVSRVRKASLDETRRHSYVHNSALLSSSPKANFTLRRGSSTAADASNIVRGNANDMREHLKHLGPSNLASRPKTTRYATVKIKPGHLPGLESAAGRPRNASVGEEPYRDELVGGEGQRRFSGAQGGEGEGLLSNAARDASDGVLALHQGYGSVDRKSGSENSPPPDTRNKAQQVNFDGAAESLRNIEAAESRPFLEASGREESAEGSDVVGSLKSGQNSPGVRAKRRPARSGSITENIVDSNGVRKVVLQTTSSSDDEREAADKKSEEEQGEADKGTQSTEAGGKAEGVKKKKKRSKKRPAAGRKGTGDSAAGGSGR